MYEEEARRESAVTSHYFIIVGIVSVDYSLAQTVLPSLLNYTETLGNAWLITALVIVVQMALILFSTFWSTRMNNMATGTEVIGIVGLTVLLFMFLTQRDVLGLIPSKMTLMSHLLHLKVNQIAKRKPINIGEKVTDAPDLPSNMLS